MIPTAEPTSLRVAVVDDDQTILVVLGEVLSDAGFRVTPFSSAPPCIDAVRRGEIDFIFSDINMPEMSGVELLKTVKQLNEEIEVVIMTADARLDSAIEATRFGAVDYLQKPFADVDAIAELANKTAKRIVERRHEKAIIAQHAQDARQDFRLAGQLSDTPLAQVLQILSGMGRDGILDLDGPPTARVYVRAGQIVHVELGLLRGKKALYRLIRLAAGAYRHTDFMPPPDGETMEGAVANYVLEGTRRKDDLERLLTGLPSLDQKWDMVTDTRVGLSQLAPWLVGVLADVIRGKSAGAALDNVDYFDLDILKGMQYLWQLGVLRPAS